MLQIKWSSDDFNTDDIDPGKDIFALLFLSFFLINAVVLLCVSKQGEQTVNVNSSAKGGDKAIESSMIANIDLTNGKACITQNDKTYTLPEDQKRFLEKARFETSLDKNGEENRLIIIRDPGKDLSAGEMLKVVQVLNDAGIGVDFRTVIE